MTRHIEEFSHLLFSQREGHISIPGALKLGKLSEKLRLNVSICLWLAYDKIESENSFNPYKSYSAVNRFLKQIIAEFDGIAISKINNKVSKDIRYLLNRCEQVFIKKINDEFEFPYNRVLDLIELLINKNNFFDPLIIEPIFRNYQASYTLIFFKSSENWNFHPITNEANRIAIQRDLKDIENSGYKSAIQHLATASKAFRTNEFGIVIFESNNAVEAIAREMTGKSTLGKAIKNMKEKNSTISVNLLNAFEQFSAFANATVRHGKVQETSDPKIGQDEAFLMFSTCAAIASYLKAQGVQKKNGEEYDDEMD